MKKTNFTPGPWKVESINHDTDLRIDAKNIQIAVLIKFGMASDKNHPSDVANARLIAAAPDLYYHLKRMITCLGEHLEQEAKEKGVIVNDLCPCLSELKKAQQAIAKAEGK